MGNKKILVVEDNLEEAKFALEQIKKFNLEGRLAQDFDSAIQELNNHPDYVLSDLFFPAGRNINQSHYIERVLPLYENYLSKFQKKDKGVLSQAIENVSKVFQTTPEKYVEEILPSLNNPKEVVEMSRDAVYGIENYSKYKRLVEFIEEIKQGKNLPYGYFLAEETKGMNIPTRIITSTNHHDITFEPIRNILKAPYYDNLIEGNKNWQGALQNVLANPGSD
ncbi:MAG: hypothetical protein KKF50_03125 [Nanoarchaeota archaeon]|nr:hypothetical protein [Nanoarchaeota archaeon]